MALAHRRAALRTVEVEAAHMAGSAAELRIAVVEGIGLGEVRHMAVAEAGDNLAAVGTGYVREHRSVAAEVEGNPGTGLVVVPVGGGILLAGHILEEEQGSLHNLAGVGSLGVAAGIPEEGIAEVEAAGILLLVCQ